MASSYSASLLLYLCDAARASLDAPSVIASRSSRTCPIGLNSSLFNTNTKIMNRIKMKTSEPSGLMMLLPPSEKASAPVASKAWTPFVRNFTASSSAENYHSRKNRVKQGLFDHHPERSRGLSLCVDSCFDDVVPRPEPMLRPQQSPARDYFRKLGRCG